MDEKERKNTELTDEELESARGGYDHCMVRIDGTERFFEFVGDNTKDRDRKYVCPHCGTRLHYGTAFRYYCDPCDESWFMHWELKPNLNSGAWQEVDKYVYYKKYCTYSV